MFFGYWGHGMYLPDDESDQGCFLRGGFTTLLSISHHFRGNPFPLIKHPIGTIWNYGLECLEGDLHLFGTILEVFIVRGKGFFQLDRFSQWSLGLPHDQPWPWQWSQPWFSGAMPARLLVAGNANPGDLGESGGFMVDHGYTLWLINLLTLPDRGWKISLHLKLVIFRVYVNLTEDN